MTILFVQVKDETVYSGDICSVALLSPGENTECNVEYTITQDDIEAGFKDGIAEFWGKSKHYVGGILKIDEDADSSVLLDQTPLLHIGERTLFWGWGRIANTMRQAAVDLDLFFVI